MPLIFAALPRHPVALGQMIPRGKRRKRRKGRRRRRRREDVSNINYQILRFVLKLATFVRFTRFTLWEGPESKFYSVHDHISSIKVL
jgi:hypothetical protein